MISIDRAARLYGSGDFLVTGHINHWNTTDDKRHVYLLRYDDGKELAIKICRNAFTTAKRVAGWQALCKRYLELGIYCPQIVNNITGSAAQPIDFDGEEYIVYAEELKKYKTYEELAPKPCFEGIKRSIVESIGKAAAGCRDLLPFPSAFCIYSTFDSREAADENYQNAESFCNMVRAHSGEYHQYVDQIWGIFQHKRGQFRPVHKKLPRAAFQSDLNPSNILVDENIGFAGYIDFNLSGSETILGYILTNEVCGYRLKEKDLNLLADEGFLKACDDYLYNNLCLVQRHYKFSAYEHENICLAYNTVYPFSCWTVNFHMKNAIEANQPQRIKALLDWVHYQLCRDDIKW